MASKGILPIGLVWAGSLLTLLGLVWLTGFLYWKVRIASALSSIRMEAPALLAADHPPSPLLHEAGSRAIPAILQEMRDAIHRKDRATANLCYGIFSDTKIQTYSEDRDSTLGWDLTPKNLSLEYLQKVAEFDGEQWDHNRKRYPQCWMWWSGRRLPLKARSAPLS